MSDLELPDLGHDLIGIDLEKGIYLSGKQRGILNIDNESNDSGNNSMNTNGSGKASKTHFRQINVIDLC